jgi:catechol 2,3-dioxygenase-like lactoylglutathione lyase family enzyme
MSSGVPIPIDELQRGNTACQQTVASGKLQTIHNRTAAARGVESVLKQAIPVLHITNADAAKAFYCGQLGFRLEFQVQASETRRDPCYMGVSRDGALLYLSGHAGDGVDGGVVYFVCDDVDSLHAEFVAKDVRIHIPPVDQTWGMRELYVLDPDGNSVRFGAPVTG